MKSRATVSAQESVKRPRVPPPVYPFSQIVGQDEMKLALMLNVIDASIGGVLIMGHRGTGKSTAVRALADLLPQIKRVRDCLYGCDPSDENNLCDECYARLTNGGRLPKEMAQVPVAELPLGATEDRVCGTLNIERALQTGTKVFEPGLLARAHRGFLYIDEVNLLEDHLIDLLLDVSVTGRNLVEREGVSIEHPASFQLVGSGNPEEGELRPQLLDRFGLHVEVKTIADLDERVRIVEQREEFERDPEWFRARSESEQDSLRRRLVRARKKVHQVELSRSLLRQIAELCRELQVDGHRGELTITRAARALAAFEGRKAVSSEDVRRVATLALRHRLRRDPLEQSGSTARIEQQLDKLMPANEDGEEARGRKGAQGDDEDDAPSTSPGGKGDNGAGRHAKNERSAGGVQQDDERQRDAPPALDAQLPDVSPDAGRRVNDRRDSKPVKTGRGAQSRPSSIKARRGRYVRATSTRTAGARIALDATLRAAATDASLADTKTGTGKQEDSTCAPSLRERVSSRHNLRYKCFKQKTGALFIFAIDTSGSMALNRIAQAKGALVRLLQQSYIRRDRVALVSFCGQGAEVMLRPSGSAARAKRLLDALSIGGATPLAAGLTSALEVARQAGRQGTGQIVLLVFTDGRANVSLKLESKGSRDAKPSEMETELKIIGAQLRQARVATVIVDTQNRFTSGGEGRKLAEAVGGRYLYLLPAPSNPKTFVSLLHQAGLKRTEFN
jgi:magnesium chelatase subunit D